MTYAWPFLLVYTLWIFFLAVMCLKRAKEDGRLSKAALVLGYPVLIVGYLLDMLTNVLVCTVLFWEIPTGRTVTGRLKYHIADAAWRGKIARWICGNLLDTFDPSGKHCT